MPLLTHIETQHLSYDEATGYVSLRMLDDEIRLGHLDLCDDECPSLLMKELESLRAEVYEGRKNAWDDRAAARAADSARNNPRNWRC